MDKLTEQLEELIERLDNAENFREELEELKSVFPFSRYEYIISSLLARGKVTFEEYLAIRDEYIDRNLYLYLFEMAPRTFGDTWGLSHLCSFQPDFKRPQRKDDPKSGEYDLYVKWTDESATEHYIRIEVKASRANDRERKSESLIVKAIASDSDRPFLMNFQQQKPSCCDVFIWIAVYRDKIKYWVIRSGVVQTHKDFSPQHRNAATAERDKDYGKADIFEGQIMVTKDNIASFDEYLAEGNALKDAVIAQFRTAKGI
jgi:hypothetical protein